MAPSGLPFTTSTWKCYVGSAGCVPINTPQTISYERLAPGEAPPPRPTVSTLIAEQIKPQQVEAAPQKQLAAQTAKQQQKESKPPPALKPQELEAEDHERLPEFDLQDIPGAMEKIGWPISAKVAREWFASPKHIYNDQPNAVHPIDHNTVTLKWALNFGSVRRRFDELLSEKIYSPKAIEGAKKKITEQIRKIFIDQKSMNLSFGTAQYIGDIRQFHIDWQFQFQDIPTSATLDGLLLTDLTGTLGNFNIYTAIGHVKISTEKYFKYDGQNRTKSYCIDSTATITHIYAYLKDNYSFNDKNNSNSQYLGHWNKKDMILSYFAVISDLVDGNKINTKMGSSKITEMGINWDYLPGNPIDKPIDKRTGFFSKLLVKNVYYPVYNKSYNEWREKHNRGGDFMIYSKPQLFKLKKPIQMKLEQICRPSEPM
ncbi:hypothetical protein AWM79_22230 [Pseudomonas agarici]|uniref:Uncharacterized protein n=2 Tax=Pseudomonas agarici TaxID=46677 RepID=A0A0X1T8F0_PSEAA|nr:DUF6402 family protein [Pseudomonas agarici]AMB88385.1 hypothetical protein AWM79_22230 [Pseudomonas agarici]